MCLAAVYWTGIKKIYYGAERQDAAEIGFGDEYIGKEIVKPSAERVLEMEQGMREQALEAFDIWDNKEDKVEY